MTRFRFHTVIAPVVLSSILISVLDSRILPGRTAYASKASVQVAIATDDLNVGLNRFAFGIIYNDQPLSSGRPSVAFYYLGHGKAVREESLTASFSNIANELPHNSANSAAVALKGVFVTYPRFKQAGAWGASISLAYGGHRISERPAFVVRERSRSPEIGTSAPPSRNPTTAQMAATLLDSGRPPDDMHRLSIAEAIAEHHPLVVLFATPAFCESRLCGPEVQIVEAVEKRYRRLGVNFIHIEVYWKANPADGYAPTFKQWHLDSEPWIFVINKRGIIVARFEGPTSATEIQPAVKTAMR